VKLTAVGAPTPQFPNRRDASRRAQAARVQLGWQRYPLGARAARRGTRLTLWHNIDRRYIAMGAAGWHICFDVLDRLLAASRSDASSARRYEVRRLAAIAREYAKQFAVEK
jgi:hypothetical protein